MQKVIATVVVIALGIVALVVTRTAPYRTPVLAMSASEVIVHEDSTARLDVSPPTILTVAMRPGGDWRARCDHMGGHLDGALCRNVDY